MPLYSPKTSWVTCFLATGKKKGKEIFREMLRKLLCLLSQPDFPHLARIMVRAGSAHHSRAKEGRGLLKLQDDGDTRAHGEQPGAAALTGCSWHDWGSGAGGQTPNDYGVEGERCRRGAMQRGACSCWALDWKP